MRFVQEVIKESEDIRVIHFSHFTFHVLRKSN